MLKLTKYVLPKNTYIILMSYEPNRSGGLQLSERVGTISVRECVYNIDEIMDFGGIGNTVIVVLPKRTGTYDAFRVEKRLLVPRFEMDKSK